VFRPLAIPEVLLAVPERYSDARGYFSETFSLRALEDQGLPRFIQDNESMSLNVGTVRGLHFQAPPHSQAKLIRCARGAFFDVAVDIRKGSPTFGRHVSAILSAENGAQMLVPAGFAHGLCTLEPNTLVQYKVDAPYVPSHDLGILWNDPDLAIEWPLAGSDATLSGRDMKHPRLRDLPSYFSFGD
jgi:dTDP-4-dehydrorhamnose 3,5-epimerase